MVGLAQREQTGIAAQLGAAGTCVQQGTVILDDGAKLSGIQKLGMVHSGAFHLAAQFGHGMAQNSVAVLGLDIVFQFKSLGDKAVVDPFAVAGRGQHRLIQQAITLLVFVNDIAGFSGQIPALEAVTGRRHDPAGVFTIKHRHQTLQRGLTRGVGTTDIGMAIELQFHHARQMGVDQHYSNQAWHINPYADSKHQTARGPGTRGNRRANRLNTAKPLN